MTLADTGPGRLPSLRMRAVGSPVLRTEDPRLLTGRGAYVADLARPGALEVAVLRSTQAHARIVSIDTAAAAAVGGVTAVWTAADVAGLPGIPWRLEMEGMKATTQQLLAADVVRYCGEPVALVVASSRHIAEDACELIEVEYEPLPVVVDPDAALAGPDLANDTLEDNIIHRGGRSVGDVDAAFDSAALVVRGRYTSSRCAASPMETRGCVAEYDIGTEDLTLWTSTQIPHFVRTFLAIFLALPEHHIRVIAPDVGGGFGQKGHMFPEEMLCCLLARALGRPVRWIEDRQENLLAGTHAKVQRHDMALAFDADGRLLALTDDILGDGGAYSSFPWTSLAEVMIGESSISSVYRLPAVRTSFAAVATNKCPVGIYRGVGWTAPQVARESLFDRAARQLGLSPFEIRRRNVVPDDGYPYTTVTGHVYREGSYRAAVDALEAALGVDSFRREQEQAHAEGRYLGLGISAFNEMSGLGTKGVFALGFPVTTHDSSTVRVEPTGKIVVTTAVVSQGQGHRTTMAQVAADMFGVTVDDVVVRAGDTRQNFGIGTWGSRGAVIAAGSIMRAAEPLRAKVIQMAAKLLEASPDDIELADGFASISGVPEARIPFPDVVGAIYFARPLHPDGFDPTLEETRVYDPSEPVFSNGAHGVVVEVDVETGQVEVLRVHAVEDCGTVLNPMIVEGQIRGGVVQAVGQALYEELVYDEHGQLATTTYLDYLVPPISVAPPVGFTHLETPSATSPSGAKGMGESTMVSVPAAILNAVNDALAPLGAEVRHLPATPERVLSAIAEAGRAGGGATRVASAG
ncbi:xanthine dehydrogenase family protein molybdopterin-binding subunit [Pseudonocardia sp.]|uniref:xanthine dehydrogenase family protein molybdopterin-binding subunit n=1 Tax=Pseudonocardia sp. TaxID=60912 RepID=UPI003D0BF19E